MMNGMFPMDNGISQLPYSPPINGGWPSLPPGLSGLPGGAGMPQLGALQKPGMYQDQNGLMPTPFDPRTADALRLPFGESGKPSADAPNGLNANWAGQVSRKPWGMGAEAYPYQPEETSSQLAPAQSGLAGLPYMRELTGYPSIPERRRPFTPFQFLGGRPDPISLR